MEPEDYRDQRADLLAEQEAAAAAVTRARDHSAGLAESRPLDAEEAMLRQMAALRQTVIERTENAPNVDALRRLLHQLFTAVYYQRTDRDHWSLHSRVLRESVTELPDGFLEPHLRDGGIPFAGRNIERVGLPLETDKEAFTR